MKLDEMLKANVRTFDGEEWIRKSSYDKLATENERLKIDNAMLDANLASVRWERDQLQSENAELSKILGEA